MKVFLNLTEKILFYLGFCLFIINISGLFISLRNESIYQEKTGFTDDINLTEKELYILFFKMDNPLHFDDTVGNSFYY